MCLQSMDDTRNVTEDGQEDVDEEVSAATTLEEDSDGWDEDGEDDLDDVAGEVVSLLCLWWLLRCCLRTWPRASEVGSRWLTFR